MAQSTGIVLAASGIAFANEWAQTQTPNLRIPIAGLGVALLFSGIEKLDVRAAVGLSYIMLITVLLTPINGKSPSATVTDWAQGKFPK